jgi:hypothetical protein
MVFLDRTQKCRQQKQKDYFLHDKGNNQEDWQTTYRMRENIGEWYIRPGIEKYV